MSPSHTPNLYRFEKPLRDLFIVPFWLFVLSCVTSFSLFGLYRTTQAQVENAKVINQVIAQTATSQNAPLTATQVATVLQQAPYIDNIVFYPISSTDLIPNHIITWRTYLFQDYIGISQAIYLNHPVTTYSDSTATGDNSINNDPAQRHQIIGHLYLTLNLVKIRHAWMLRYLALLGIIIMLALCLIGICFKRVKPFFIRLSHLEQLSEKIINNKSDELKIATNADEKRWIFSLALEKLIDKQQHLINQIKQLIKKNRHLNESQENYVLQYSHFQNVITHELKLSLNQAYAGLKLLNSQYTSQEQKDAIGIIDSGIQKLDDKLNQIIYISRLEKGQIGISLEKFDPLQLLDTIIGNLQPIAREKGLILTHQSHFSSYTLEGDSQKITLILTSIIENAIKFTEKGKISVSSQLNHLPKNLHWQVTVNDTGIGLSEHALSQLFQRFFQVNPNHTTDFKEIGVGLYSVRKLLDLIGGEIQVESDISQGSTFRVNFPLNDWQKSLQYSVLRDKTIGIFDPTSAYKDVTDSIIATGAMVQVCQSDKVMLHEVNLHPYTALIFMPNVMPHVVSKMTQQIRQSQTQQRTLIIYTPLPTAQLEKSILLADGVDYINSLSVRSDDNELNEQHFIKNLVIYLS